MFGLLAAALSSFVFVIKGELVKSPLSLNLKLEAEIVGFVCFWFFPVCEENRGDVTAKVVCFGVSLFLSIRHFISHLGSGNTSHLLQHALNYRIYSFEE